MFESFEIPDLSIFKQIAHQIFPHNLPRLRICFLSPGLCELLVLWLKFSTMAAPCRVWKGSGWKLHNAPQMGDWCSLMFTDVHWLDRYSSCIPVTNQLQSPDVTSPMAQDGPSMVVLIFSVPWTWMIMNEHIASGCLWYSNVAGKSPNYSEWRFQPPWKILVRLDHHANYWGK